MVTGFLCVAAAVPGEGTGSFRGPGGGQPLRKKEPGVFPGEISLAPQLCIPRASGRETARPLSREEILAHPLEVPTAATAASGPRGRGGRAPGPQARPASPRARGGGHPHGRVGTKRLEEGSPLIGQLEGKLNITNDVLNKQLRNKVSRHYRTV